jgi:hypothetical protein
MGSRNVVLGYVLWLVLSVLYIFGSAKALTFTRQFVATTENMSSYFLMLLGITFLFGVFVRIPSLVSRWHSNNSFDYTKLLILGMPALFLFMQPLFFPFFPFFEWWGNIANQSVILYFVGIWAGMIFVDSIKGLEH